MKKLLILTVAAILTGCTTMRTPRTAAVSLEFRPGSQSPGSGLTEMTVPGSKTPVYISEDVALSNADVQSTRVLTGPNGHQQIEIVFTKIGAERFAATTERLIRKPLGILVDGKLISAPVVMDKISGGKAIITGGFSVEEAKRIADGITGQ
jgi:preprotein translocase subunit SecD